MILYRAQWWQKHKTMNQMPQSALGDSIAQVLDFVKWFWLQSSKSYPLFEWLSIFSSNDANTSFGQAILHCSEKWFVFAIQLSSKYIDSIQTVHPRLYGVAVRTKIPICFNYRMPHYQGGNPAEYFTRLHKLIGPWEIWPQFYMLVFQTHSWTDILNTSYGIGRRKVPWYPTNKWRFV